MSWNSPTEIAFEPFGQRLFKAKLEGYGGFLHRKIRTCSIGKDTEKLTRRKNCE